MKKINIYVTGANGFIGKYLINYFKKFDKYKVLGVSHSNKNYFLNDIIYTDYKDIKWLENILRKSSILIHTAAYIPKEKGNYSNKETFHINSNIDKFITNAFLGFADKVIYFSSVAIYGYSYKDIINITEQSPVNILDYYSKSKLFGERVIRENYRNKEYILRLSSPYGIGKNNIGILEKTIYSAINNEQIEIYGSGNRTQDYIYISDICKVIHIIIDTKIENGVYNLASGMPCNMSQLIKIIIDTFKSNSNVLIINKNETPSISIDNAKICKKMNIEFLSVKEGIYDIYRLMKNVR